VLARRDDDGGPHARVRRDPDEMAALMLAPVGGLDGLPEP